MKKLYVLLFVVLSVNYLSAQNQQTFQYHSKQVQQLLDKNNRQLIITIDSTLAATNTADTAFFIKVLKDGKVYALPQDRMPCIKPDSAYAGQIPFKNLLGRNGLVILQKGNTPNHIQFPATKQRMPNAYKGNAIAFE